MLIFARARGGHDTSGHIGGVSYVYDDLRDYDQRCYHYGSTFWFRERLKGHFNFRRPEYHLSCGGGRIYMEPNPDPPEYIKRLLQNKHFMENIRAYNQMFAMTSFGANIDESIYNGRGPYVFKVSGQIRLYNADSARGYELPTSNTLGAIVFYSGVTGSTEFDVVIEHRGGPPMRINKLYRSYMSLQFPLLLIYGQSRFHTELKLNPADGSGKERRVTMFAYYAYQLHPQVSEYNLIFRGRRLFQQYVVGVFYCIEQNRLDFIRKKQNDIRSDYLSGLYDVISRGKRNGLEVGGRIILPMSFTGEPRYIYANYLDA
ncbi:DNA helicase [Tanacetum coccineum]